MNARFAPILAACTFAGALAAQWGPVVTPAAPSPRSDALLSFDLIGNRTVMFGGNGTNEFWSLANGVWTPLNPAVRPSARARAAVSNDVLGGTTLLYGGVIPGQSIAANDTWAWYDGSWQQLAPGSSPGGRIDHAMAHDLGRQETVLFGGRTGTASSYPALAETWVFGNGTWSQVVSPVSPPPLLSPAMAYHPALGGVVLFGGQLGASTGAPAAASGETWWFDGAQWTQLVGSGPQPSPRVGADLVWVVSRSCVLLFGGRDPQTFAICNDTWEHDGVAWRQVTGPFGSIQPARAGAALAYDVVRDRVVAFGGVAANNELRDDTWEYGAQFQRFGSGCAGTAGVPALIPGDVPRLGGIATAAIHNVPAAMPLAFVAIGTSRTQWAGGALPAQLGPIGMPGCRSWTSADLLVQVPAVNGIAAWSTAIPWQPALFGEVVHLQGVTLDPGANAFGFAVSNAATLVVGW
jgi:hypothetical protein